MPHLVALRDTDLYPVSSKRGPMVWRTALQAPERIQVLSFTTDLTDETDSCLVAIK